MPDERILECAVIQAAEQLVNTVQNERKRQCGSNLCRCVYHTPVLTHRVLDLEDAVIALIHCEVEP